MSTLNPCDTIRCKCETGYVEHEGASSPCPVCDGEPIITYATVAEYARQIDDLRRQVDRMGAYIADLEDYVPQRSEEIRRLDALDQIGDDKGQEERDAA